MIKKIYTTIRFNETFISTLYLYTKVRKSYKRSELYSKKSCTMSSTQVGSERKKLDFLEWFLVDTVYRSS